MLKRTFGSAKPKHVKRVGVLLDLAKPLDIYDMRKTLFGRFISAEKNLPLQAYYHTSRSSRDLEMKNRDILEKLDFRFDQEVEISQEKLSKELETAIAILQKTDKIRQKDKDFSTYSMSEPTLTIKDMRVGEFEYNLAENMKSPIFHIQKNGVWSPNFLFSCLNENLGDLVLVENDIDFMQAVYKLCLIKGLDKNECRFLHLSVVTGKQALSLTRSRGTSLDYLLNEVGIDKLALMSYIGHLGYQYSEAIIPKDPFVALKSKMLSLKEMSESFKVDLLQSEPCLFAHEELQQMNKFFFRNRINVCEKPSQKAYLEALILKWGGQKLLSRFKDESGDLDKELIKETLWEVKSFSDIQHLGEIFDYSPTKIKGDELLMKKLESPELKDLLVKLSAEAKTFFSKHSFENRTIGKLISTLLLGQKTPEKTFSSLEAVLFGRIDHIGILVKAKLVGQDEFLRRIEQAKNLTC